LATIATRASLARRVVPYKREIEVDISRQQFVHAKARGAGL